MVWLTVEKLPASISPDAQCAVYLALALPALAILAYASYRRPTMESRSRAAVAEPLPATA
jgi:hypothetical protein